MLGTINEDDKYILHGILKKFDMINGPGRIYPKEVYLKELDKNLKKMKQELRIKKIKRLYK